MCLLLTAGLVVGVVFGRVLPTGVLFVVSFALGVLISTRVSPMPPETELADREQSPRSLFAKRTWDFMWWRPWNITQPWRPRAFRGSDEWHNPSWCVIVPFLGAFIVFRLDYERTEGGEHLHAYYRDEGWQGVMHIDCEICHQLIVDVNDELAARRASSG